jgi:uncharacterized protein (DUF1330 family)
MPVRVLPQVRVGRCEETTEVFGDGAVRDGADGVGCRHFGSAFGDSGAARLASSHVTSVDHNQYPAPDEAPEIPRTGAALCGVTRAYRSEYCEQMAVELCVLLWASPGKEEALSRYEDTVLALIPNHGGRVVSRVRRVGEGTGPLEVQVIHMPSEAAVQAYMQDPERLTLADIHREAVARTELLNIETIV